MPFRCAVVKCNKKETAKFQPQPELFECWKNNIQYKGKITSTKKILQGTYNIRFTFFEFLKLKSFYLIKLIQLYTGFHQRWKYFHYIYDTYRVTTKECQFLGFNYLFEFISGYNGDIPDNIRTLVYDGEIIDSIRPKILMPIHFNYRFCTFNNCFETKDLFGFA